MDVVDAALMEGAMIRNLVLISFSLSIAIGLLWISPPLFLPQTVAAQTEGIDVLELTRNAPAKLPAFEDTYQGLFGDLDAIKPQELA